MMQKSMPEDETAARDRKLLTAYSRTVWSGTDPDGDRFALALSDIAGFEDLAGRTRASSIAILTAWNPASDPIPEDSNRARNEQLAQALEERGVRFIACEGRSPGTDEQWCEESFACFGIARHLAVSLGARYEQNAIVWWERRGRVELLACRDGFGGAHVGDTLAT